MEIFKTAKLLEHKNALIPKTMNILHNKYFLFYDI